MSLGTGWYVAIGTLVTAAILRSRRAGEMTAERDRIYRECLSGRVTVEQMRSIASAFERARCFPQARMLRLRIGLEELPEEIKEVRKETFRRCMASTNRDGILRVADAYEREGATSSAAKLRAHAERLPKPDEIQPIVTPPPTTDETAVSAVRTVEPEPLMNGSSNHVAIPQAPTVAN